MEDLLDSLVSEFVNCLSTNGEQYAVNVFSWGVISRNPAIAADLAINFNEAILLYREQQQGNN